MKCKWNSCDNEVESKGTKPKLFCSDACRMKWNRSKANITNEQVSKRTRPLIPGDAGYIGVCVQVDGRWVPRVGNQSTSTINRADFNKITSNLPDAVTMPSALPTIDTANMTAGELARTVSNCKGPAWINCPEYAETILRLLTRSCSRLRSEGQFIPAAHATA